MTDEEYHKRCVRHWRSLRTRAAAGSVEDAWISLVELCGILKRSLATKNNPTPMQVPQWFVEELCEIFDKRVPSVDENGLIPGTSLEVAFHLAKRRGRNRMKHAKRDMDITYFYDAFGSFEVLADKADALGIPPPGPGRVWTADALAKAVKAHEARIKDELLFLLSEDPE